MNTAKLIFAILLLSLTMQSHAYSDEERQQLPSEQHQEKQAKRFERLSKKLSLRDDQKEQVKAILKNAKEKRHTDKKSNREELQQQLSAVLDSEQMEIMEKIHKKRKMKRREHKMEE